MTKMMLSVALIVWTAYLMGGTEAVPAFTTPNDTASVAEGSPIDTSVYRITTTGTTGTVTFNMTGATEFQVTAAGLVTVKEATLDHEGTAPYTLTISGTDTDTSGDDTTFDNELTLTLTVANVAPTFPAPAPVNITDGSTAGTVLGVFVATDPGRATLAYDIVSGNTNDDFTIDQAGEVTVNNSKTLDASTTRCYRLGLKAEDNGSPVMSATTTVEITVKADPSEENCFAAGTAGLSVPVLLISMCLLIFFQK